MRKLTWTASALPLLALFGTEAAFFLNHLSPWRRYAGLSWIIIAVFVLVTAVANAFIPFFRRQFWTSPGRWWYLTAFIMLPVLVLFDIGSSRFTAVDLEGTQQLAEARNLLHADPSLGILSLAYARYMARQYVLNYLPTYFFGPSLRTLRIGTSMFYLGSYAFFLTALATYLRQRKIADALLYSAFCGVMIGFGQYALLNARKFEQTSMPIGCMLFFMAALLYYEMRPGPLRFLWLTWSFGFFADSYTPGLAGLGLGTAILAYFIVVRRDWRLALTIAYGLACLYVACMVSHTTDPWILKGEFAVGTDDHLTAADWTLRMVKSVRATVGTDYTLLTAPTALTIFSGVYLAWRLRDYRFGVVVVWSLAVLLLSVLLMGSSFAFPVVSIQRALIIIPPLIVGSVFLAIRYTSMLPDARAATEAVRFFARLSMVYMVFTATFTVLGVRAFFGPPVRDDEDEIYDMISKLVTSKEVQPKTFYVVPPMVTDIRIGTNYFAPDATVYFTTPPVGEKVPGFYVISFLKLNPDDRFDDEIALSRHPRPFIKMEPEYAYVAPAVSPKGQP
jgi:hypothetical protein